MNSARSEIRAGNAMPVGKVTALILLCIFIAFLSLNVGVRSNSWADVWASFTNYDSDSPTHIVIQTMRLPRTIAGLLCGAALGVAGTLMQGLTRNPLADPGLLGVNAGAAIGVVLCLWIFQISDPAIFIWAALIGAFAATLIVYVLGGAGRANTNPVRLVLAGAAISAFFLAMVRGVLLLSHETLDVYRFWVLGGLAGIRVENITPLIPFYTIGFSLAFVSSVMMNTLILGSDVARSLGLRVGVAQICTGGAIVLLCATAVSLAGPIAFVGLIVPHITNSFSGADMRWRIIFSSFVGGALLLAADIFGRVIFTGTEIQAGVIVAVLGGPMLIYLVRYKRLIPL